MTCESPEEIAYGKNYPEVFQPTTDETMKLLSQRIRAMRGATFSSCLAPALSCIRPLPIAALVLPYFTHSFIRPEDYVFVGIGN
jgi:hypothetical protein